MLQIALVLVVASLSPGSPAGAKELATVKIPLKAELYANNPQPLTPMQCGQCHESYFNNLKANGGKHRFECQECHKSFHAYNPTKGVAAYQELMPKCAGCHALPHGKGITDCASCHNDPHAIKKPVMGTRLAGACGDCHAKPKAELIENPSKHTKVACDKCHTSHGFKPNCNMCHKAHYPEQGFDTCTKCHKVHKPKLVTYGDDTANATCTSCHAEVAGKLKKSPSKHSAVSCVTCHQARHKAVPQCAECHEAPHPKVFLDRYPVCLTCHLDPHDLPSMGKK
ncbi:MAG: cytochrome C [Desulfuromonas sp.]|nr:cytochrome C [Desulfuromonas sp.]